MIKCTSVLLIFTRLLQENSLKEGLFLINIDMEVVGRMVFEIATIIQNSEIFSLANHSRKQLFRETMVMYFRGISTEEGIKMIDK